MLAFYKSKKSKGGYRASCKVCEKEAAKLWSKRNKEKKLKYVQQSTARKQLYVLQYLKTKHCVDCGEDNILVLEFDHTSGEKKGSISNMIVNGKGLQKIKDELDKCEVRCRNCHVKRHHKERNTFKYQYVTNGVLIHWPI